MNIKFRGGLLGLKDFKMILRVTTAQLQLLEGLMLSEMRSKTYQRRDKGKRKKSFHQPKAEDTNQEKLYLLHMDLCGPISRDEAPDAIIKCIKNIQVRLNATGRNVRTYNGTKFVNQTLRDFYENVGISHQTYVARTPQ
ncbi:retrovirus-related pol polyprotein from transposon TNT 1-94 [Tanacetum coccineum]